MCGHIDAAGRQRVHGWAGRGTVGPTCRWVLCSRRAALFRARWWLCGGACRCSCALVILAFKQSERACQAAALQAHIAPAAPAGSSSIACRPYTHHFSNALRTVTVARAFRSAAVPLAAVSARQGCSKQWQQSRHRLLNRRRCTADAGVGDAAERRALHEDAARPCGCPARLRGCRRPGRPGKDTYGGRHLPVLFIFLYI